jgi:hypothetical protein
MSLTGGVLTPPCLTLLRDSLLAGLIRIQLFFKITMYGIYLSVWMHIERYQSSAPGVSHEGVR